MRMGYRNGKRIPLEDVLGDPADWVYVGGDTSTARRNKYKLYYGPDAVFPEHNKYCVCDHVIEENCYIAEKRNMSNTQILGNCCIMEWLPMKEDRALHCAKCGEAHQNRRYNLCNNCGHCKHHTWKDQCPHCGTYGKELRVGACAGCDLPAFAINMNEDGECEKCITKHTALCTTCNKETRTCMLSEEGKCGTCVNAWYDQPIKCKQCKIRSPRREIDRLGFCNNCYWQESETKSGESKWSLNLCSYGWASSGQLWALIDGKFIRLAELPQRAIYASNTQVKAHIEIRHALLVLAKSTCAPKK